MLATERPRRTRHALVVLLSHGEAGGAVTVTFAASHATNKRGLVVAAPRTALAQRRVGSPSAVPVTLCRWRVVTSDVPGMIHTLTINACSGRIKFNSLAVPEAVVVGRSVARYFSAGVETAASVHATKFTHFVGKLAAADICGTPIAGHQPGGGLFVLAEGVSG